jgi:rfaE bifunctional protein kinase chain/domain
MIDRGRPTALKTRVIAHSQQVVRIDREDTSVQGVALSEGLAAMADAHLDRSQLVIISDYGKGTITESVFKRLNQAKANGRLGAKIRPLVIDPHPENYDLYNGITIAKPNRKEAEAAVGFVIDSAEAATNAAEILRDRWNAEMMMITLGEGGLMILPGKGEEAIFLETVAQEVFDVSGAGDTVTALFSGALAVGASPSLAGDLANIAAGLVVSEVGTVPISLTKLVDAINEMK